MASGSEPFVFIEGPKPSETEHIYDHFFSEYPTEGYDENLIQQIHSKRSIQGGLFYDSLLSLALTTDEIEGSLDSSTIYPPKTGRDGLCNLIERISSSNFDRILLASPMSMRVRRNDLQVISQLTLCRSIVAKQLASSVAIIHQTVTPLAAWGRAGNSKTISISNQARAHMFTTRILQLFPIPDFPWDVIHIVCHGELATNTHSTIVSWFLSDLVYRELIEFRSGWKAPHIDRYCPSCEKAGYRNWNTLSCWKVGNRNLIDAVYYSLVELFEATFMCASFSSPMTKNETLTFGPGEPRRNPKT